MATVDSIGRPLSGNTGTGNYVGANTPTLITPVLGVVTATSITFGGSVLSAYNSAQSWTPVFTFATLGDLSVSYSAQTGAYTKIGDQYTIRWNLVCTPTFTTSSGDIQITGLPAASGYNFGGDLTAQSAGVTYPASTTGVNPVATSGVSYVVFTGFGSATASVNLSTTSVVSGVAVTLSGSITYTT